MARTSRNTVKKYIHKWNSLQMSFDEFQAKRLEQARIKEEEAEKLKKK